MAACPNGQMSEWANVRMDMVNIYTYKTSLKADKEVWGWGNSEFAIELTFELTIELPNELAIELTMESTIELTNELTIELTNESTIELTPI